MTHRKPDYLACAILPAVLFAAVGLYAQADAPRKTQSQKRVVSIKLTEEKGRRSAVLGGLIDLTNINDVPLSAVLEMLSQKSGYNIEVAKESIGAIKVTVDLQQVQWQDAIEFIASKYKLTVDYSKKARNIIIVDKPQQITYNFTQSNVKDVINIIARQADANIIMDDQISGTITMRLRDIPWRTALELVVKTAPQDLAIVEDEENKIIRIVQKKKIQEEMETRIFRLSYIQPLGKNYSAQVQGIKMQENTTKANILDVLKLIATADKGKIAVDGRSNSLIIKDTPVQLDAMQKIITELDIAPKQIHIAVRIINLNDDDAEELGIKWEAGSGMTGFGVEQTFPSAVPTGFPFMFGGGEKLTDTLLSSYALTGLGPDTNGDGVPDTITDARTVKSVGASFPAIGGTQTAIDVGRMSFLNSRVVLSMLQSKSRTSLIQTPDIITLDNEAAVISVGKLYRYAEQTTVTTESGATSSGFQEARGSPISMGVDIVVIPHVTGTDNNILLTLLPKLENLDSLNTFTGPDGTVLSLPQTSNTQMSTTMLVRNRETVVVGGLKTKDSRNDVFSVPFLGDIPVLKWLFRSKSTTEITSTLYVFVTPTIIDFNDRQRFERELSRIREEFSKPFVLQENISPR